MATESKASRLSACTPSHCGSTMSLCLFSVTRIFNCKGRYKYIRRVDSEWNSQNHIRRTIKEVVAPKLSHKIYLTATINQNPQHFHFLSFTYNIEQEE